VEIKNILPKIKSYKMLPAFKKMTKNLHQPYPRLPEKDMSVAGREAAAALLFRLKNGSMSSYSSFRWPCLYAVK
jgi:hypothetical protein